MFIQTVKINVRILIAMNTLIVLMRAFISDL